MGSGDSRPFLCPTCTDNSGNRPVPGLYHNMEHELRLKVSLSSSQLHEFWNDKSYEGDRRHVDWVTSPGGTIDSLMHCWLVDYEKERKPQDILLITGLNDIIQGNAETFMEKLEFFWKVIKEQSVKYHPNSMSTFACATLVYVPQLCKFPTDPYRHTNTFINHLQVMEALNRDIESFNDRLVVEQRDLYVQLSGNNNPPLVSKAPGFHRFGVREKKTVNRLVQEVKTKTHRFSWFREVDRNRKLHLTNQHRTTMGRAVVNYFSGQFNF